MSNAIQGVNKDDAEFATFPSDITCRCPLAGVKGEIWPIMTPHSHQQHTTHTHSARTHTSLYPSSSGLSPSLSLFLHLFDHVEVEETLKCTLTSIFAVCESIAVSESWRLATGYVITLCYLCLPSRVEEEDDLQCESEQMKTFKSQPGQPPS